LEVNLIIGGTQFCLTSSRPGQTRGYISTPRHHYRLRQSGAVTSCLLHSNVGNPSLCAVWLRQWYSKLVCYGSWILERSYEM
jgi:hypothetical protein